MMFSFPSNKSETSQKAIRMSLTQRAKKKFMTTLSKKKKMKILSPEADDSPSPHPSYTPHMASLFSVEKSPECLKFSKSLPDHLDQSGSLEKFKLSLLYIASTASNPEISQHTPATSPNTYMYNYLSSNKNVSSFPSGSAHVCAEAPGNHTGKSARLKLGSCDIPAGYVCQKTSMSRCKDDMLLDNVQLQNNHCLELNTVTEATGYLDYHSDTVKLHQQAGSCTFASYQSMADDSSKNSLNNCQFPVSDCPSIDHNVSMSSSYARDQAESTDDEIESVLNDLKMSIERGELYDDVFMSDPGESLQSVSNTNDSLPVPRSASNSPSVATDFQNKGMQENCKRATKAPHREVIKDKNTSEMRKRSLETNGRWTRIDNPVLMKIKFFEHYNEKSKKNANTQKGSTSKDKSKRSLSTSDVHTKQSSSKFSRSLTMLNTFEKVYEGAKSSSSNKYVKQTKPASSHRVFSSSSSVPRLNFSRFRRSDSIPEVVSLCSCGAACEETCTTYVVEVEESNSNVRDDELFDESKDDRLPKLCQVCHHPECTEDNNDMPLMLCGECDLDIHNNPQYSAHLVLDLKQKNAVNSRQLSAKEVNVEVPRQAAEVINDVKVTGKSQSRKSKHRKKREDKLPPNLTLNKGDYNMETAHNKFEESIRWKFPKLERMNSESSEHGDYRGSGVPRCISLEDFHSPSGSRKGSSETGVEFSLGQSRNRRMVLENSNSFTLKLRNSLSSEDELVVVAAFPNKTLREAIQPVLHERKMDVNSVEVFIGNSQSPLPMTDKTTIFLAGNTLEVRQKDKVDSTIPVTAGQGSNLYGSRKGSKQLLERNFRRDSTGIVSLLLEAPPTKQRRGSLQLPFKEHFFAKTDSKMDCKADGSKMYSDSFSASTGGRSSRISSIDDTLYLSSGSTGSIPEVKRRKPTKLSRNGSQVSKDKERLDQLTEILNRYNIHGLPPFPELLSLGRRKFDGSMLEMESSWKIIVNNNENLTKKQHNLQEAVWELLKTEVSYIRQIRVIIDVFQSCLINIQESSLLNEIETERLFGNIDEIFECNCVFWQQYLLPILQYSRDSGKPLNPMLAKEGFVKHFPNLFEVYFKYLMSHKSSLDYVKACMENSDLFKTFIQWAESQKQCNRLQLVNLLAQPMPRLLRYPMLLRAIHVYTENDSDKSELQAMIQSVEKLCVAANSTVGRREQFERLEAVRKTIDPFDAFETPNDECAKILQEYAGNFNLLDPMPGSRDGLRSLVFQSNLKMKEGQNAKMDVDCLLFTDLLLICKSNKKIERFKIIRPPMRLDQLVVSELKDKGSFLLIYINEYSVPISAFTFHSDSGPIRGWLEKFKEAQREFKAMQGRKDSVLERLRSDTVWTQGEMDIGSLSSVTVDLDVASSALPRTDSADSLDRFLPNLLTASKKSSSSSLSEHATASSLGNAPRRFSSSPTQNYMPHAYTDSDLNTTLGQDYSVLSKHRLYHESTAGHGQSSVEAVQTSRSFPDITGGNNSNVESKFKINPDISRGFQDSIEEDTGQSFRLSLTNQFKPDRGSSLSQTLTTGQNNITSNEEDFGKIKLNSRRTDKRYRTADEISDIKNAKKDSSIHKWSSLRMDVQLSDAINLDSTVLSTDSLQSFPSSSGVSSTGSLHLPMETNEDQDGSTNDGRVFNGNYSTRLEHHKHLSVDDTGDFGHMEDFVDGGSNQLFFSESKHSKSKSTSDLVEVFSSLQVSQMTDGIASVAMTTDGFQTRLSHYDILKLKKIKHQILFDANVESSEV